MKNANLKSSLLFFVAIFFCLLIAYFPQLNGDFIGDDVGRIMAVVVKNPLQVMYKFLGDRPILVLSIWLDRFVLSFEVLGMRIENLLYLSLLCLITRELMDELSRQFLLKINPLFRDGLLLLFALHPLNTQAVGHIVQRGVLLSLIFSMLSTLLLIRSRGNPLKLSWKVSLLSWCLALLTKPNIAFMPIWWGIVLWAMGEKKNIKFLLFFIFMLVLPVINYKWGEFNLQNEPGVATPFEYFITQGQSLLHYFRLMIWPWPLYFIHDLQKVKAEDWWIWLPVWIVCVAGLVVLWKKSSNKPFNLFITAGFLAFLPESSFFPIIHVFFEHRAFAPFLFFIAGLCLLPVTFKKSQVIVLLSVLNVAAATGTYLRSEQVKTYAGWVYHDLKANKCTVPYFVHYTIHQLIARNLLQDAERTLAQITNCASWDITPDLLKAELDFAKAGATQESIDKLKVTLHSDNFVVCNIRNGVNQYVISEFGKKFGDDEGTCKAEDFLAQQLRYLTTHPQGCLPSINMYYHANLHCTKLLTSRKEKSYQLLKMRTIMYSYFRKDDKTLKQDLEVAANDKETAYLQEIFNKVENDKKVMEKISLKKGATTR